MMLRLIALSLILLTFSAGCASRSAPLIVEVRDQRTQAPVPGAWVQVRPVHLFLPQEPYSLVDPWPEPGDEDWTDDRGRAELNAVVDHPFHVRVISPGYLPLQIGTELHPLTGGATGWLSEPPLEVGTDEESLPRLEVRLAQ